VRGKKEGKGRRKEREGGEGNIGKRAEGWRKGEKAKVGRMRQASRREGRREKAMDGRQKAKRKEEGEARRGRVKSKGEMAEWEEARRE
jgi:hypothetical protein